MDRPTRLSEEIQKHDLQEFVLDLEVNGLAVVPPEVHGVTENQIDLMVELILERSEAMIGTGFSLGSGPKKPLDYHPESQGLLATGKERHKPSQFLIQQLATLHRAFRDLAINPVAVALIRHLIGEREARFSSHNSFVKWQGEFGYGPSLGLHCDQTAMPLPWGRTSLTANTNWCLSEYTLDGGALAYVPGSHRRGIRPVQPQAAKEAVPVEASKGSVIVFHGATWHGAFPRKIPGMRISVANYYRHHMVVSQEDIRGHFARDLADDCDDPSVFKKLAGFEDTFPYTSQNQPLPMVAAD